MFRRCLAVTSRAVSRAVPGARAPGREHMEVRSRFAFERRSTDKQKKGDIKQEEAQKSPLNRPVRATRVFSVRRLKQISLLRYKVNDFTFQPVYAGVKQ